MAESTVNQALRQLRNQNRLGKLWFVWRVYEENAADEIAVNKDHAYALGHSKLLGIFWFKSSADKFANKVPLIEH